MKDQFFPTKIGTRQGIPVLTLPSNFELEVQASAIRQENKSHPYRKGRKMIFICRSFKYKILCKFKK